MLKLIGKQNIEGMEFENRFPKRTCFKSGLRLSKWFRTI